jgi:hypothetical protein
VTGPSGANGINGATGATGPQGPFGPTGAQGAQGTQGSVGPTGPAGSAGPGIYLKDANGVSLGRLVSLVQGSISVSVITSTGYLVSIPLDGQYTSLATAQTYLNNAACTLTQGTDRIWLNGSNSTARPTYSKLAVWGGPTIGSFLTPIGGNSNNIATSAAMTGVVSILNPTCMASSSANFGWELRKATLTEIGLPATIATPLQFPTN